MHGGRVGVGSGGSQRVMTTAGRRSIRVAQEPGNRVNERGEEPSVVRLETRRMQ